jgi:hypothetical protein
LQSFLSPLYDGPPLMTATFGQWKVLVVDEASRKLINSAVKDEEILNLNVSSERVLGPSSPRSVY